MARFHPEDVPKDRGSMSGTVLFLLVGPLVWALHFAVCYAAQSLLCTLGLTQAVLWDLDATKLFVVAATLLAAGSLAVALMARGSVARMLCVVEPEEHQRSFHRGVMFWAASLSIVAVAWTGATIFIVDSCGQLR